jgi:twitching motility protein PilI
VVAIDKPQNNAATTGSAGALEKAARGLGFEIAGQRMLIPVDQIQEMCGCEHISAVPLTKPWLIGVTAIRSEVYTICDLNAFVTGGEPDVKPNINLVVLQARDMRAALYISKVIGLRSYVASDEPLDNAKVPASLATYVRRNAVVGKDLWMIFEPERLILSKDFRNAAMSVDSDAA